MRTGEENEKEEVRVACVLSLLHVCKRRKSGLYTLSIAICLSLSFSHCLSLSFFVSLHCYWEIYMSKHCGLACSRSKQPSQTRHLKTKGPLFTDSSPGLLDAPGKSHGRGLDRPEPRTPDASTSAGGL